MSCIDDLEEMGTGYPPEPSPTPANYVDKLLATFKQPKRPIANIIADLKPIPAVFLDTLKDKGNCKYPASLESNSLII